jgi:hypothetical protein
MELGFPFTLNFATLYLDRSKLYIFCMWRNVSFMSHKIFMNLLRFWNYHEFLKCLLKKFVFVIKCTLKLWMFFTVCVNYNEKHNGGWKSSDLLKLVFHISFFVWWNFFLCLIQNYQEFQSCVAMLYMLLILYAYVKCWNTFLFFIYYF